MQEFNEQQWLKLLFLLADTQTWLDDMAKDCLSQLPVSGKKILGRKTYYLTPQSLAHIVERHYYKISRYPHAGKFHISVCEIVHYLREASHLPAAAIPGSMNFRRVLKTNGPIGFDKNGSPTNLIIIVTNASGRIITAYPGEEFEADTGQIEVNPAFFFHEDYWNDDYFEKAKQIA